MWCVVLCFICLKVLPTVFTPCCIADQVSSFLFMLLVCLFQFIILISLFDYCSFFIFGVDCKVMCDYNSAFLFVCVFY